MNSARSLDTLFELNQLAAADKQAAKPAPSADFKAVKLDSKSSAAPVSLGRELPPTLRLSARCRARLIFAWWACRN